MPFSTLASHNPIDYLSFSSFYVETYFNEHILSKATAFCYKKQNQYYLVSNWHVMSGRYPIADKNGIYAPQSKELSIPNKIKVFVFCPILNMISIHCHSLILLHFHLT